jgi:hypothetical protein
LALHGNSPSGQAGGTTNFFDTCYNYRHYHHEEATKRGTTTLQAGSRQVSGVAFGFFGNSTRERIRHREPVRPAAVSAQLASGDRESAETRLVVRQLLPQLALRSTLCRLRPAARHTGASAADFDRMVQQRFGVEKSALDQHAPFPVIHDDRQLLLRFDRHHSRRAQSVAVHCVYVSLLRRHRHDEGNDNGYVEVRLSSANIPRETTRIYGCFILMFIFFCLHLLQFARCEAVLVSNGQRQSDVGSS